MTDTPSLNIPKSVQERASRSVLFGIIQMLRSGEMNNEQAIDAILHWHNSVNADA